jgi:lysophospholipid acyltransferase (LPLAT)-like uncharacterized protein
VKKVLRHPVAIRLLSHIIWAYIWLVYLTARRERHFAPGLERYRTGEHQTIIAFWHARLLMMPMLNPKKRRMNVLISQHRDGRLISETMVRFGIGTVAGSSSKGALSAFRGLLRSLKDGANISITPDGPRGPARIAAPGVAQVAITSGLPVIPMTFAATRHRRMRSWDRFFVPLPFTRLVYGVGEAMQPSDYADDEAFRQAIEDALNRITDEADRLAGVPLEESAAPR